MTGTELGRAREALGLSQEELAQALEVGVQDVAEWERSDRIPRGLRYPLKLVLWQRACQVVLDGSGIPECEWFAGQVQAGRDILPDEVARHVADCTVCAAREAYVSKHAPPQPIGGGVFHATLGALGRLSGWRRSAAGGAVLLLAIGGIGGLLLLGSGIVARDAGRIGTGFAVLVLLALSGAAGGIVHYITTPIRQAGTLGHYVSWILSTYGYMLSLFAMIAIGEAWLGDSDTLGPLLSPFGIIAFVIVTTIMGSVAGRAARSEPGGATLPVAEHRQSTVQNVVIMVVAVLGIVLAVLNRSGTPTGSAASPRSLPALEQAVRDDPQDVALRVRLADALLDSNRRSDALEVLQEAVRIAPDNAEARALLGWTLGALTRYVEAIPELELAIRLEPDHRYAHEARGRALMELRRYDEAAVAYSDAVRINPDGARLHYEYGWVLTQLHRLDDAAVQLREATRLEPTNPDHHAWLATALMRGGRPAEALVVYQEAAEQDPENVRIWYEIARLTHFMARYDESDAAFHRVSDIDASVFEYDDTARGMWAASREQRQYSPPDGTER